MAYSKTTWVNDAPPAINASNLNKIEQGIYDNDSAIATLNSGKVDKVIGKGLSTNDYTSAEKTKLAGIETGANKIIVDSVLSSSSTNPVQNKVVNEFKLDKGETAVSAKGIILATPVREEDPYVYRKTPVASSLSAKMHSIIGVSIAWNQLIKNGNFASTSNWTKNQTASWSATNNILSLTCATDTSNNRIYQQIPTIQGHKYLVYLSIKASASSVFGFDIQENVSQVASSDRTLTTSWVTHNKVISAGGNNFYFVIGKGITDNVSQIDFANVHIHDLTQMFGSEIADYVYTLEQAMAGSGIAWLEYYGFFTEDYYAYDSGSIQSVNVSGKKVVGFNQWDEQWEQGAYNSDTGAKASSTVRIRCKNKIKILSNTEYCFFSGTSTIARVFWYDSNEKFISSEATSSSVSLITSPNNARYVTFQFNTAYGLTYLNNACVNVSSSKNGTYAPYETATYPLDSSKTLRGLFKLATNKLTVDGDIYNSDGSLTRKYGVKDLSTISWTQGSGSYWYTAIGVIPNGTSASIIQPILCDKYVADTQNNVSQSVNDKTIAQVTTGRIAICDSSITSSSDITGILIYQLATTTSETATPFVENEKVGTEEFIDYGVSQNTRDVAIPVGTETDYYQGMELPPLPTASGNHNLQYNPSTGFSWS